MKNIAGLMLAGAILIPSCATVETSSQAGIGQLAGLMIGTFATPESNTGTIITDRRVRVEALALDGVWFYSQLNTGAEGKLYRQRLSHLTVSEDGQAFIQKSYGLKTPEIYTDAWDKPGVLASLTDDDFEPYFEDGCDQVWTPLPDGAWSGYVDPQTCVITSKRRNKDIRIESEGYISKDEYRTTERGYDMDMTFLWGSKPGEMITLYPVR